MPAEDAEQRFRQLFSVNYDAIRAYCLRRLPADEAADAVSEVFLVAWRRSGHVSSDDARLWLFGIARNVVRNMDRTTRRRLRAAARVGGLAVAHASDPETQVVAADEHEALFKAFHRLGPSDQEILRLRLWEEMSVADSASVLGIADKAASKRYQRALRRLGRALDTKKAKTRTGPHLASRGGDT